MEDYKDPSKTALTVSVSNAPVKSQADIEWDEMQTEMEQATKDKAGALVGTFAFDKFKQMVPMIKDGLPGLIALAPMGVAKMREYFENGKIQIQIYLDEETGALVFEKVHMDNIDLTYKKDTPAEDFFIITKQEQDNPQILIDKMQQKIGSSLF